MITIKRIMKHVQHVFFVSLILGILLVPFTARATIAYPNEDRSQWMKDLFTAHPHTEEIPFNEFALPGSHNAGTHNITAASYIIPGSSFFYYFAPAIVANWAKTQADSIGQQLQKGSRYFDIRLYEHNSILYTQHTMLGMKFEDILSQIQTFSLAHPKELIVLDLRLTDIDVQTTATLDMINKHLGPESGTNLLPPASLGVTTHIKHILDSGRVVVFFDRPLPNTHPVTPYIWNSTHLDNRWADTTDTNYLINDFIDPTLAQRESEHPKPTKFLTLSLTQTPDETMVIRSILGLPPRSIKALTDSYRPEVYQYLEGLEIFRNNPHVNPRIRNSNVLIEDYFNTKLTDIASCMNIIKTGGHCE